MEESIVMLVIIFVVIILLIISFVAGKKKNRKKAGNSGNIQNRGNDKRNISNDNVPRKDMSEFIKFDKIANDMIYQNKGEKYTMVIQCKGINYDLMSEIEQMSVEEGFIKFLNTLKSPVQLYVQTRTINLNENIKKYKDRTALFSGKYSDVLSKYNEAEEDIDIPKEELERLRIEKIKYANIAEYAADITKYIEKMSLNKYMLQRKYYVILSYYKSEISTTEKFTKDEYEELCYRELYTRAQALIAALTSCSVAGKILNSNELAELVYVSYNRDDQRLMDIKRALESGFYRLYTTSSDVREKRQAMLDLEIKQEAAKRVEEAIKEGLAKGTLMSAKDAEIKLDKMIDKEAIKIVNELPTDSVVKENVKDIITEKRKEKLRKMQEENENNNEKYEEKDEEKLYNSSDNDAEKLDEVKISSNEVNYENDSKENEIKEQIMDENIKGNGEVVINNNIPKEFFNNTISSELMEEKDKEIIRDLNDERERRTFGESDTDDDSIV